MRLLKLTLENFQGIRELTLEPNGESISIRGRNGSGKTTVANAISWLLYGKSVSGLKDYSPQTRIGLLPVHSLNHVAEGVFVTDDGEIITLKKDYHEIYTRYAGINEDKLTGHTTEHYINGVPMRKRDYDERLESLVDPKKAQTLADPKHFAETMKPDERLAMLLEVFGDVTFDDVIAANPELASLREYLSIPGRPGHLYSLDDYLSIAKAEKKRIKQEQELIPARIDQEYKGLPEEVSEEAANAKMAGLMTERDALIAQKNAGNTDDKQRLRAALNGAESALFRENSEFITERERKNEVIRGEAKEVRARIADVSSRITAKDRAITATEILLSRLRSSRDMIKEQIKRIRSEEFKAEDVCPACGQSIPDSIRAAAEAAFISKQDEKVDELKVIGAGCSAKIIQEEEAELNAQTEEISRYRSELTAFERRLVELENTIDYTDFKSTSRGIELFERFKKAGQALNDADNNSASEGDRDALIARITQEISALAELKGRNRTRADALKRIDGLKSRERQLAAMLDRVDLGLALCDEFTRCKSAMFIEGINKRFKTVKFELFQENIGNDGIKRICEIICLTPTGEVAYSKGANEASRANASLEIIDVLSKRWGLELPILIDGAQSIDNILPTAAQQIRLYVDSNAGMLEVI